MSLPVNGTLFLETDDPLQSWKLRIYPPFSSVSICWLPISGSYCLLPRILFYCTIVFALVGWAHRWLIAGALAASFTYSGQAAIHACLLAWRGPISGENDIYALVAILSVAAIITVPLLNWSRSLRQLDQGRTVDDHAVDFSKVRSIIIIWGLLIAVGLFSVLVLVVRASIESPDLEKLVQISTSCWIFSSPSNYANLRFTDPTFTAPLTTNYSHEGIVVTIVPFLDAAWAVLNGCQNPCQNVQRVAIFRSVQDYQLIGLESLNRVVGVVGDATSRTERDMAFQLLVAKWAAFLIPFIIVQGVLTAAFGRRSPTQIRDAFYIILHDGSIPFIKNLLPKWMVKTLALILYGWAILVTVLCMPVLIVSIVAAEMYIAILPQSESAAHIGAWSPWVGTGLILIGALFSRFQEPVSKVFRKKDSSWRDLGRDLSESARSGFRKSKASLGSFFITTPSSEWASFRSFLRDADTAEYYNRHGQLRITSVGQEILPTHSLEKQKTLVSAVSLQPPQTSKVQANAEDESRQVVHPRTIPLATVVNEQEHSSSVSKAKLPRAETR